MSTTLDNGGVGAGRSTRGFGFGFADAGAASTGPPMMPARSPIALLLGTLQYLGGDGCIVGSPRRLGTISANWLAMPKELA